MPCMLSGTWRVVLRKFSLHGLRQLGGWGSALRIAEKPSLIAVRALPRIPARGSLLQTRQCVRLSWQCHEVPGAMHALILQGPEPDRILSLSVSLTPACRMVRGRFPVVAVLGAHTLITLLRLQPLSLTLVFRHYAVANERPGMHVSDVSGCHISQAGACRRAGAGRTASSHAHCMLPGCAGRETRLQRRGCVSVCNQCCEGPDRACDDLQAFAAVGEKAE